MSQCVPPIPIRPCVLKYLGKTHNLWFRSTLMLEHQAFEKGLSLQIKPKQTTEFYEQESITPPQQVRPPSCVNYIFLANDIMVLIDISQVILDSSTVKLLYWGKKVFVMSTQKPQSVFSGDIGLPCRTLLFVTRGRYVGWFVAEALQVFRDSNCYCLWTAWILWAGSHCPMNGMHGYIIYCNIIMSSSQFTFI